MPAAVNTRRECHELTVNKEDQMDKERERKDEPVATKPEDKKLTDLNADKKAKDVKAGGGAKIGTTGGEDRA
jgi:hypothetical protein